MPMHNWLVALLADSYPGISGFVPGSRGSLMLDVVFVAMFVAFIFSVGMVGMIVMWIALRHSGALPFESIGR